MNPTDRCSPGSARVHEPMAGTAPEARTWLVIEQPGPWGRQALTESHLDPAVGGALAFRAHGTGVSVLLIRQLGKHADHHEPRAHRTAWLAHTAPGHAWMRRFELTDPRTLLELDLDAAGAGSEPDHGVRDLDPLLLMCTNAKRDQCCAIEGRPAAVVAGAAFPGRVWECSHLGGHRFSATALLLPHGFVHGRLDGASASHVLAAASAGITPLETLRGRTCWSGPAQAAEIDVRRELALDRDEIVIDAVAFPSDDLDEQHWHAEVRLADGTTHHRSVRSVVDESVLRRESCFKDAVPLRSYRVEPYLARR